MQNDPCSVRSLAGKPSHTYSPHKLLCGLGNALSVATRFYRKLARRQEQVLFGRVDASSHPELARQLGLTAVPSFVTFREGEVVTSKATSSKKNIEKLVEELLFE